MRTGKKILAFLLAVVMICSMIPAAAATEEFPRIKTWSDDLFTDVSSEDWYYENVKNAYELGLMSGYVDGRFNPTGNISIAQTIAVAARIHAIATMGEETFVQGTPWYQVYVDYALATGILDNVPANINEPATRLQFAHILAKAMPKQDLKAINTVKDGAIPDVKDDEAVYLLYRAGVLTGSDSKGTFNPNDTITRRAVTAIIARMAVPELREEVKLPASSGSSGSSGGSSSPIRPAPETPAPEDPDPEVDDKLNVSGSAQVEVANGAVSEQVTIEAADKQNGTEAEVQATVPAGVEVEAGKDALTLTVVEKDDTDSNISVNEDEEIATSYDVHVDGVAATNTQPILVNLGKILSAGMNIGNVTLYHVENGAANVMTQVLTRDELDAHNEFYYDPVTGDVTVAMATFSEVAVVKDAVPEWEGNFDYTWYNNAIALADSEATADYVIANADQLAAFGAIVGGMNGQTQDSFAGKTVKLQADVNLGDKDNANESLIFHPIGYYYTDDKNADGTTGDYYSTVNSFEGTFDGNGHTIANFYQNTWEIKGDYDGNYYSDAMGLFGYIVNGKVCNLTVDNFSSDGEFTPTGVIAAYAANSTFENLAITNCNPRVYNTGNGGIVGIGGNSDDPDTYNLTFTNITIDNTNKITALWGSWDVACGGLVGMFRGAGHVYMTNCHVAAQIDVYNDVCGNYQYYWYRYSGMMVGTNKNMTTDANGYTVPETDKFHAENCTVHFGDWNDYYYCELVANSLASYTHDHQFSRLTEIGSLDEIKSGDTWTKAGNFLLISGDTKTCYHIVKNADGTLKQHLHTDAGEEAVNGETVLKEDKQIVYLPFNQLFTGYGWGVKHIPIYDDGKTYFEGITILGRDIANSVEKFEGKVTELTNNQVYKLSDIFSFVNNGVDLVPSALTVTVTNLDENNPVSAEFVRDDKNWENGTLKLTGTGKVTITIQDYYFCTPTTITVNVTDRQPEVKFESKFTGDFLYRVGNQNAVKLDSLFKAKEGATIGTVSVTVEALNGTGASGTYTSNATWTNGIIRFSGTGVVKVTITDNDYCTPTVLYLEVVDAVNATTATSATSNNVVLLNNCGFSTIEVSGGHTLYGNGFTITRSSDAVASDREYAFVSLENGTLDNVKIVCPNFSHAILYESNKTESGNEKETDSNGKTRYYNIYSAIKTTGNSKILNSYVSGGRAAVYAVSGTLLIENSTVEGGAAANIHTGTCNLTLRDVTLIQEPKAATVHTPGEMLMGLSVIAMCDGNGLCAPITLEGTLTQYAWACEEYKAYVPSAGQSFVSMVLKETDYIHKITYADGVTRDSLNLGFLFMSDAVAAKEPVTNGMIVDNRADEKPYGAVNINGSAYVYSYQKSKGTSEDVATKPVYSANRQDASLPTVSFTDTNDARTFDTAFDETNGNWVSTLKVDVDQGDYEFSFEKLLAQKYGQDLTYTVATTDGIKVDKSTVITLSDSSTAEYVLTITDDQIYDQDGEKIEGASVTHTHIFKLLATKTSLPAPSWVSQKLTGTPYIVVTTKNSDWNCAVPVLDGIKVKYWSKAQKKEVELDFADVSFSKVGEQNGTNNSITITGDEYTLTITSSGFKTNDNGKPVVVNDKLYFTVSSSSNYVSTSTTSRTPSFTYTFTDANNSDPITTTQSMTVTYATYKGNQYDYSSFCKGTLKAASSGCVTPDTLITLADGTQVRVDSLTGTEELLVWNHTTGAFDIAPVAYIVNHDEWYGEYEVITLGFSDGTNLDIIQEHVFFDVDLNQYVALGSFNAEDYMGHSFVKANEDNTALEVVQLVDVEREIRETEVYEVVTYQHLTCFTNDILSCSAYLDPLLNIFDIDPETMAYNAEKVQEDIETYGLYTYEDFEGLISEEAFELYNGAYLKVAVGKGYIDWEDILELIDIYFAVDVTPISE